ncbi:MAG TPA: DUF531 family protein [Candidatus Thermoplasmatota archaeon]|nr:DUF531 family protein [Candidatus Thermoplasmatota archaeon]
MVRTDGRGPRLTLGLYNSYDPARFHEQHRRTLARVAPLAMAYDCNVATFGFPFDEGRRRERPTGVDLRTPVEIADFVADSTTIGEGGKYFRELASAGRFAAFPFPDPGFPPQLGTVVLTTSRAEGAKALSLRQARELVRRESATFVFGLGPHGAPREVFGQARHLFDVTGRGLSLETATAMGAVVGALAADRAAGGA